MPLKRLLPRFVAPMLAGASGPFDSDEHLFEVKWDGIRALAFVEGDGYRLFTRWGREVTHLDVSDTALQLASIDAAIEPTWNQSANDSRRNCDRLIRTDYFLEQTCF